MGRLNVIRGVRNSRLSIEVIRASTYTTYDIGKRYSSTSDGSGVVSVVSATTTSCRIKRGMVIINRASVKVRTITLTFVVPFILLVFALFLFVTLVRGRLCTTLLSLTILIPCCCVL